MARGVSKKKVDYGSMVDQTINTTAKEYTDTLTPGGEPEYTGTPAPTYTPAHTPNRNVKERKTERLQLLVRPSTKARLAKYAQDHNTSSNEVVQRLLDNLLDEAGY